MEPLEELYKKDRAEWNDNSVWLHEGRSFPLDRTSLLNWNRLVTSKRALALCQPKFPPAGGIFRLLASSWAPHVLHGYAAWSADLAGMFRSRYCAKTPMEWAQEGAGCRSCCYRLTTGAHKRVTTSFPGGRTKT